MIPEQVVFKMDLEIREFNFLKSQYPADTTKSLYYVFGLNLIFWSSATTYNKIFSFTFRARTIMMAI
jgi:hypothetical protein